MKIAVPLIKGKYIINFNVFTVSVQRGTGEEQYLLQGECQDFNVYPVSLPPC